MADDEGTTVKRLNSLEFLRFAVATHVIMYYLFEPDEPGFEKNLVSWGVIAPSFFFVLSGFVLSINYWERKENYSVKEFFVKRFARIYPAYLVANLLLVWRDPMAYVSDGPKLWERLWHILGVQAWYVAGDGDGKDSNGFDDPGWPISVIIFLYALFPILLKTTYENFNSRKSKALVIVLLWPMDFVIVHILKEVNAFEFDTTLPILHIPAFFIGVVTGGLYMVDRPAYNGNVFQVLFSKFAFSAAVLGSVVVFGTVQPTERVNYLWKTGILAPFQAFVIYWAAVGTDVACLVLNRGPFGIIGGLSYGMYLFLYHADMFRADCEINRWDFYIFVLAVLCVTVRFLVEVPAYVWVTKTFKGDKAE